MVKPTFRELRPTYGFDEVAIVPGDVTINPDQTDVSYKIGKHKFEIPIIASAMDGVTDPAFAVHMGKLGGLAVLNLEGVQTRYDNPNDVLSQIARAPETEVTVSRPLRPEVRSAPSPLLLPIQRNS
jgi:IMP dehydrogenase